MRGTVTTTFGEQGNFSASLLEEKGTGRGGRIVEGSGRVGWVSGNLWKAQIHLIQEEEEGNQDFKQLVLTVYILLHFFFSFTLSPSYTL
jgi:hypothetical protein